MLPVSQEQEPVSVWLRQPVSPGLSATTTFLAAFAAGLATFFRGCLQTTFFATGFFAEGFLGASSLSASPWRRTSWQQVFAAGFAFALAAGLAFFGLVFLLMATYQLNYKS